MPLKFIVFGMFIFNLALAEDTKPMPAKPKALSNAMAISYGSVKWNNDPAKIDSASVVFRDAKTKKAVLIIVDESAPNSSSFQGKYLIRWGDEESIEPEVYIPSQEMVKKQNWLKDFNDKLRAGKLDAKPLISRQLENGERVFDVFDTQEQANEAAKAREEALRLEQEAKEVKATPQMEKVLSKTAAAALVETEQLAKIKADILALAAQEAAREAERMRLAQIEKQREEERQRIQAELNEKEKKRRKDLARKLAEEALEVFKQGNFVKAEELYRQSVDLDPNTRSYYYYYGIALFRNDKNNESIVILNQVESDGYVDMVERDYYLGLNYFKLKESENALTAFRKVKAAKHKSLSSSAAFYEGLVLFQNLKYEEAKGPFQEVLDNPNSDPKLDAQAEKYLEQIAGILYFAAQKAKRILTSASLGAQYDSNILYTSDTQLDQGTVSNAGGARYLFMGSAQFRPIYETDKEFGSRLGVTYMYSADAAFASSDPLLMSLTFPFVAKGTLLDYGSKWDITPGADVLYQDANGDGTKENYLNAGVLTVSNTLVLSKERVSVIGVNMRQDEFPTSSDSSGFRLAINTTQMKFLNTERNKILTGDFIYAVNNSRGNDYYYSRIDAKGTYMAPLAKSTQIVSLGYYMADYAKKSTARLDNNYALNWALSSKYNDIWTGTVTANYTMQNSSDSSYTYKKYSVLYMLTANYDF